MANEIEREPEVVVIKWRGPTRPRLNRIDSSKRAAYRAIKDNGNMLFLLCEDEHIYEWGHWRIPIFLTWQEFVKFYREYNIKII